MEPSFDHVRQTDETRCSGQYDPFWCEQGSANKSEVPPKADANKSWDQKAFEVEVNVKNYSGLQGIFRGLVQDSANPWDFTLHGVNIKHTHALYIYTK